MNEPLISVIVPVYNVEKYLNRCIDSILSQTYTNFELLLINDGSSDKSGEICDEYAFKDSRIKVFHKDNGGVSSARNMGINNANGEWVIFVDADDFLERSMFNAIILCIAPSIHLVHYGWCLHGKEKFVTYNVCEKNEIISLKQACKRDIFHGYVWSYVFRTSILKKRDLRFSEDLSYAEDWEFIIKFYSCANQMYLLKDCLYNYVYRLESATNEHLGSKYIMDNFSMYLSVRQSCVERPDWFRLFVTKRIYDINIWLVNNVLFRNKKYFSDYKQCYRYLLGKEVVLGLSPLLWAPLYVSPWLYSLLCRIYNRFKRINGILNNK